MADLQFAPPAERSPWTAIIIAVVVLAAVGAAIFYFNPHRVADLSVPHVDVFAPHTEFSSLKGASGMNIIQTGTNAEDNLYIVATVHIDNKLRLPLFITGVQGTLTDATGQLYNAHTIGAIDLGRLETTFPQITPMVTHPLQDDDQVPAKSSLDRQVLLLFPTFNADTWQKKKAASITLNFAHQEPQTVAIK